MFVCVCMSVWCVCLYVRLVCVCVCVLWWCPELRARPLVYLCASIIFEECCFSVELQDEGGWDGNEEGAVDDGQMSEGRRGSKEQFSKVLTCHTGSSSDHALSPPTLRRSVDFVTVNQLGILNKNAKECHHAQPPPSGLLSLSVLSPSLLFSSPLRSNPLLSFPLSSCLLTFF